jgi:hypothetical protein
VRRQPGASDPGNQAEDVQIDVLVPSDENLYARVNPARNGSIYELNAQDGTVSRRFKLEDGRSGRVWPVSMTESSYPSNTAGKAGAAYRHGRTCRCSGSCRSTEANFVLSGQAIIGARKPARYLCGAFGVFWLGFFGSGG